MRGSYAESGALLASGGADLALVCTGSTAYPGLRERFEIAYRLRFADGSSTYRSAVVVREHDPATSLLDLEGAAVAWVDPDSFTGYRLLRRHLRQQGLDPDSFFGDTTFTYGHDRAMAAVRDGVTRAAAIDEQTFAGRESEGLRVLWRSDLYPSPPLLVTRARPDLKAVLDQVKDRPDCLSDLGAAGLDPAEWSDYDAVGPIVASGE